MCPDGDDDPLDGWAREIGHGIRLHTLMTSRGSSDRLSGSAIGEALSQLATVGDHVTIVVRQNVQPVENMPDKGTEDGALFVDL